jgi:hypothetical protein
MEIMSSEISVEKLKEIANDVIKKYPVILKEDEIGCVDLSTGPNEALKKGEEQWREIREYLQYTRGLKSREINIMFVALRGHYNWLGWTPSVKALIYMVKLG